MAEKLEYEQDSKKKKKHIHKDFVNRNYIKKYIFIKEFVHRNSILY